MKETVGAILLDRGCVLLGLRARHKSFAGCWDIIGGHMEHRETRWTALCRELFEEIGITDVSGAYIETLTIAGADGADVPLHVHGISHWTGIPRIGNDEHDDLRWFTTGAAAKLPNLVSAQYARIFASL